MSRLSSTKAHLLYLLKILYHYFTANYFIIMNFITGEMMQRNCRGIEYEIRLVRGIPATSTVVRWVLILSEVTLPRIIMNQVDAIENFQGIKSYGHVIYATKPVVSVLQ